MSWYLLTSHFSQEVKCIIDMPTGQHDGGTSSIEISSSPVCLSLYQVNKFYLSQWLYKWKIQPKRSLTVYVLCTKLPSLPRNLPFSFFLINADIIVQFNQAMVILLFPLFSCSVILAQVHSYALFITLSVIKFQAPNSWEEIFIFPHSFRVFSLLLLGPMFMDRVPW